MNKSSFKEENNKQDLKTENSLEDDESCLLNLRDTLKIRSAPFSAGRDCRVWGNLLNEANLVDEAILADEAKQALFCTVTNKDLKTTTTTAFRWKFSNYL